MYLMSELSASYTYTFPIWQTRAYSHRDSPYLMAVLIQPMLCIIGLLL